MPIYELILSIVYVILALFLIVVVILQSGKSSGCPVPLAAAAAILSWLRTSPRAWMPGWPR